MNEETTRSLIQLREIKAMREVSKGKQKVLVEVTALQEILRKRLARGDKLVDGLVVKCKE